MDSKYYKKVHIILILLLYSLTLYVVYYNFINEVEFQRFSNIFAAFITLNIHGYIDLSYLDLFTLIKTHTVSYNFPHVWIGLINNGTYYPNLVILHLILNYVTGLQPHILMFFPFGALFIPLIYLAMAKEYIGNCQIPAILAIFSGILYLIAATSAFNGFYAPGTSFPLIFIIFLCLKKYSNGINKSSFALTLIILFWSIVLYWHTAHMLVFFFIFSLWLMSIIFPSTTFSKETHFLGTKTKFITSLFILVFVISLTFTQLWKSSYLDSFSNSFNLYDFISRMNVKLHGGIPYPMPYAFNYKVWELGKVYFISTILILVLDSLLWATPIIIWLYSFKNKKIIIKSKTPFIFGVSILLAQIMDVVCYYQTGCISFIYVPIFFPIFATYMFYNIDFSNKYSTKLFTKLFLLSLFCVVILSSVMMYSYFNTHQMGATSITKYDDTEDSFNWLYSKMDRSQEIVTDFNILGKYLQRECKISKPSINYKYITPDIYSILVGDNTTIPQELTKDYIVVDHATMLEGLPIYSGTYQTRLLEPRFYSIDNTTSQNKIYADNRVSVFVFRDTYKGDSNEQCSSSEFCTLTNQSSF